MPHDADHDPKHAPKHAPKSGANGNGERAPAAIQAIAFDWGGIFTVGTFDSSASRSLAALLGVPLERVEAVYYPLMEEFEAGAFDLDGFRARFARRIGLELDPAAFRETFLGSVRERPAMYGLLASIPERYTVGMLSNNVPVLCDLVRDDARMARIDRDRFVFSNEIRVRKPDPAAFEALTAALGVPPSATAFVDDNAANIEACEALGFTGLLLDTWEGFTERWRAVLPDLPLPDAVA